MGILKKLLDFFVSRKSPPSEIKLFNNINDCITNSTTLLQLLQIKPLFREHFKLMIQYSDDIDLMDRHQFLVNRWNRKYSGWTLRRKHAKTKNKKIK